MSAEEKSDTVSVPPKAEKKYDLFKRSALFSLLQDESDEGTIKKHLAGHVQKLIEKHELTSYRVVFLYDDYEEITQYHSNKLYEAISDVNKTSDILMVLVSDGGKIEPAYLISKTCKRLAKNKFCVSIPRRAKSAATLIALGANEIHMGLLSELGPIDPQFGGFPALGLANALEKIAFLSAKFPGSAEMFAQYLTDNLNIRHLGYFERINESATQYAERLLEGKSFASGKTAQFLADHFTNHYKDHSFVIDADEAASLLGSQIVLEGTKEYGFGNELYGFLEFANLCLGLFKKRKLRFVGSIEYGFDFNDLKPEE